MHWRILHTFAHRFPNGVCGLFFISLIASLDNPIINNLRLGSTGSLKNNNMELDMKEIFERAAKAELKRENKVFNRDMRPECHIDVTAQSVMECVEERVSKKLYEDMMDFLLGYSDDMQLVIADNFLDAVCYGWKHYIGIHHIDNIMRNFYFLINEEMTQQSN